MNVWPQCRLANIRPDSGSDLDSRLRCVELIMQLSVFHKSYADKLLKYKHVLSIQEEDFQGERDLSPEYP